MLLDSERKSENLEKTDTNKKISTQTETWALDQTRDAGADRQQNYHLSPMAYLKHHNSVKKTREKETEDEGYETDSPL